MRWRKWWALDAFLAHELGTIGTMETSPLPGPHNRFFLQVFSRLEFASSFLRNHLPPETLANLDLSSLRLASGSFQDDELRETEADLLFKIDRVDSEEPVLVYVLTEHKSYPDAMMPFQLLKYMVRVWERDGRDNEKLRPIIPIVIYHGETRWTTARSLRKTITAPENLVKYIPDFQINLIDLGGMSDTELSSDEHLKPVLLLLKYIRSPTLTRRLVELLGLLSRVDRQYDGLDLLKSMLVYISTAGRHVTRDDLVDAVRFTFKEKGESLMPTIAEGWVEEGRQEGRQEGLQEGLQEGRQEGRIAGQIQLFEGLLGRPESGLEQLLSRPMDELTKHLDQLRNEFTEQRGKPDDVS